MSLMTRDTRGETINKNNTFVNRRSLGPTLACSPLKRVATDIAERLAIPRWEPDKHVPSLKQELESLGLFCHESEAILLQTNNALHAIATIN